MGLLLATTETFAELLDLAGGVYDFLFASEKRMTLRANLNLQAVLTIGGASDEAVATAAGHVNLIVLRMDIWPHVESSKTVAARKEPGILVVSLSLGKPCLVLWQSGQNQP
jgi:hypothetical protein